MSPTRRTPTRWPWSADSLADRYKRVAQLYREALRRHDPEECERLDQWARDYGQTWVVPAPFPYNLDDELTPEQVADACHVEVRTVYAWHRRGLPYVDGRAKVLILVRDLVEWEKRRRQLRRGAV